MFSRSGARQLRFVAGLFLLLPLLCLAGVGVAPVAVEARADDGPAGIPELRQAIEGILRQTGIPGVGVALVRPDSVLWSAGLGVADTATGRAVTERTPFRVASITKTITALAYLRLVEEGRVDSSSRLVDVAPDVEVDNPWRKAHPVRLVHLLEHTAGIDDVHFNESFNLRDPPGISLGEVLAINPRSRTVVWPPGERMAYSNDGYAVVGRALEKVTGEPYAEYVSEQVLAPLGMRDSGFDLAAARSVGLAQGYLADGVAFPAQPLYMRPASSLISSTRDLARLVRCLLANGELDGVRMLGAESVRRMETPTSSLGARSGLTAGYGLGNRTRYYSGFRFQGHGGSIPGFTSLAIYSRQLNGGFVLLANSSDTDGFHRIARRLVNYLARGVETPTPPPAVHVAPERLAELCGEYEYASSASKLDAMLNVVLAGMRVFAEDDTLYSQGFLESPKALIPVGQDRFRRADQPEATLVFTRDGEGRALLVDMDDSYVRRGMWNPVVYRALLGGALVLMISCLLYAAYWIPMLGIRRVRGGRGPEVRLGRVLVPTLAVLSLLGFGVAMGRWVADPLHAGTRSPAALGIFVFTLLFGGLSGLGLLLSLRGLRRREGRVEGVYCLVLSLALVGVALFLAHFDVMGLRVWRY